MHTKYLWLSGLIIALIVAYAVATGKNNGDDAIDAFQCFKQHGYLQFYPEPLCVLEGRTYHIPIEHDETEIDTSKWTVSTIDDLKFSYKSPYGWSDVNTDGRHFVIVDDLARLQNADMFDKTFVPDIQISVYDSYADLANAYGNDRVAKDLADFLTINQSIITQNGEISINDIKALYAVIGKRSEINETILFEHNSKIFQITFGTNGEKELTRRLKDSFLKNITLLK